MPDPADLVPGEWVADAACGDLDPVAFTPAVRPDEDDLRLLERICRRCPVREPCASYAASTAVWGVWAGRWHNGAHKGAQAA